MLCYAFAARHDAINAAKGQMGEWRVEDIERNPYIDRMQMVSQLLPKAILLNMPIVFFHDILAKWAPTKYK